MVDKIILKKDGLWTSEWDSEKKEHVIRRLDGSSHLFLSGWHRPFEIEGTVLLKDLVDYLKTLDPFVIDLISVLCDANLEEYLKEEHLVEQEDPDKESNLSAIEVYKYFELSNYEDIDRYDMQDHAVSCHGIGSYWKNGFEDIPLEERGNSYAIEFTPWAFLLNLPLTMKQTVSLNRHIWKKQSPTRMGFKKKGSEDFEDGLSWVTDRTTDRFEDEKVVVSYHLGEFLYGLFDELCFFWNPNRRDERQKELADRLEESKNANPEDFSQLVEEKEE